MNDPSTTAGPLSGADVPPASRRGEPGPEGGEARPTQTQPLSADVPRSQLVRARRPAWFSWTWLVPLAALLTVAVLAYQAQASRGPRITIRFRDGHGIQPGDPVVFRGVRAGEVRDVAFERGGVSVRVQLLPSASFLAGSQTQFWIVHPQLSLTRVSGLETLFGPKYIQAGPVDSDTPATDVTGLDGPPATGADDADGLELTLLTPRRGSLGPGSPVSYRDIRVGQITAVALSDDARHARVAVLIEPRYAPLVRANTRFWNASGIGVEFGIMTGFSVRTESLESVIAGGVSFATPDRPAEPAQPGDVYDLAPKPEDDWLDWSPVIDLGNPANPRPG